MYRIYKKYKLKEEIRIQRSPVSTNKTLANLIRIFLPTLLKVAARGGPFVNLFLKLIATYNIQVTKTAL